MNASRSYSYFPFFCDRIAAHGICMEFHGSKKMNIQHCGSAANSSVGVGIVQASNAATSHGHRNTFLLDLFIRSNVNCIHSNKACANLAVATLYLHDHFPTTADCCISIFLTMRPQRRISVVLLCIFLLLCIFAFLSVKRTFLLSFHKSIQVYLYINRNIIL